MLVLNRKANHTVCIGEDVEVTVIGFKVGNDGEPIVELGFKAPSYVTIDRQEVRKRRLIHIKEVLNGVSTD